MTGMEKICTTLLVVFSAMWLSQPVCAENMNVRHATGGQSMALEIEGEYWYQTLGDKLVVIRKEGNGQVSTRMITAYSAEAVCTDLMTHDQSLYALLDGKEIVIFSLRFENVPKVIGREDIASLGIVPQGLVMVGDWPVVIGKGGAVRLTDGQKLVSCEGEVTGIALSVDRGLVYAMDRKLFDADTSEFLGSATTLVELDEDANADFGTLVYTRSLEGETEVGLMGSGMRDINTQTGKIILDGEYRNLLSRKSRLLVSTDQAVYILGIAPDELRLLGTFDVEGVRDVDIIGSNYLAMCGEFGRGVYRIKDDRGGLGDQLIRVVPTAGEMSPGVFVLRGVQVPTGNGSLYYGFDQSVRSSEEWVQTVESPTEAVVLGYQATIDSSSGDVVITDSKGIPTRLSLSSSAMTIVPISGNFWVGTQDGVYVFGRNSTDEIVVLGNINLAGPIIQLIPLFDGNAAFVSKAGMVGIIDLVQSVAALEQ